VKRLEDKLGGDIQQSDGFLLIPGATLQTGNEEERLSN
jgi:hypothetical protein